MWTRSLLVRADGTRDAETWVGWLQGRTLFADLRQPPGRPDMAGVAAVEDLSAAQMGWLATQEGFAGVLADVGECVEWRRRIDYQPASPHPDVGHLFYEGPVLVERGRDSPYVEHWHRDVEVPEAACWGATMRNADGVLAWLVRAGETFMFARDRATPLPPGRLADLVAGADGLAAMRALVDCELSLGRVRADGWLVERSTLPFREGRTLTPSVSGDRIRLDGEWVAEVEGEPVVA